jgi:AcrR family transcriptional regulator
MGGDKERGSVWRRVPQQERSRDRVERILEVTDALVTSGGVEAVTTRAIAGAAGIPVASLYQYFADKEAVLLALMERDLAELDAQVAQDVAALSPLTVRTLVEATMRAYLSVYRRHRSLLMIFVRGRTNPAVRDYCRDHNRRLAKQLFEVARNAGMVVPDATGLHAELAIEVSDRLFQVAFDKDPEGDPHVVDEAIAMVSSYLESHATSTGVCGPPS